MTTVTSGPGMPEWLAKAIAAAVESGEVTAAEVAEYLETHELYALVIDDEPSERHAVLIHDATPMFADVLSGATRRPREPEPGEDWSDWARDTHGYDRAVTYIFRTAVESTGDDNLYSTPLVGPNEPSSDPRATVAREQFGEPGAAVLAVGYHGRRWLIALNADGTRACTIERGRVRGQEVIYVPLP